MSRPPVFFIRCVKKKSVREERDNSEREPSRSGSKTGIFRWFNAGCGVLSPRKGGLKIVFVPLFIFSPRALGGGGGRRNGAVQRNREIKKRIILNAETRAREG